MDRQSVEAAWSKSRRLALRKYVGYAVVALLVLAACVVIAVIYGSVPLPVSDFFAAIYDPENLPEASRIIIFDLRLPRVELAMVVGAALALAGCGLQGILRNPLADPYIVGTSSGASLGAALAIVCHIPNISPYLPSTPIMAFLGAVLAMLVVYKIARVNNVLPVETFLLAGVIVGSFTGAVVSLLMTVAGEDLHRVILWMMGTLGEAGSTSLWLVLPYLVVGGVALFTCAVPLNIVGMGEENAQALGVNVERLKTVVVLACSLMTAAAVSAVGMIGFLGLVVPHVTRMLVGPDHRLLMPIAAVNGASFLVIVDAAARVVAAPQELPVGVLTALAGAPFFFWILKKRAV